MQVAGVVLLVISVALGALALLMAAVPRWPRSVNDPSGRELGVMGTIAAALFVVGIVLTLGV
jgi:hypothetical protein